MSKTRMFVGAVALLAGGVLLIGPQLTGRNKDVPAVETKTLRIEKDDSFPSTEDWLTRYTLTERSGKSFESESLDGKVHIVNFFFTSCPHSCALQTEKVRDIDRSYGPHGVHFVSITCDPDTDTPAVLQQYAERYAADPDRWLFLTGDTTMLERVAAEMYRTSMQGINHSPNFVVVGKWGKIRGSFPWNNVEEVAKMKELLDSLLAETEPPVETAPEVAPADNESADNESVEDESAEDESAEDDSDDEQTTLEEDSTVDSVEQ